MGNYVENRFQGPPAKSSPFGGGGCFLGSRFPLSPWWERVGVRGGVAFSMFASGNSVMTDYFSNPVTVPVFRGGPPSNPLLSLMKGGVG